MMTELSGKYVFSICSITFHYRPLVSGTSKSDRLSELNFFTPKEV